MKQGWSPFDHFHPVDAVRVDTLIQYALAVASKEDDERDRELGPIHLLKYVYLGDLAYAEKHAGQTYTGAPWQFYKFGPWSQAVHDRIEPAALAMGAIVRTFDWQDGDREGEGIRYRIPDPTLATKLENDLPFQVTGSIAMINSDVLERASLFSASYPQRFGDRTGAWLDFGIRDGSRERVVVRGAVSGTNASAVAEGPLGRARAGSWLFSIRQSYLDWIIHRVEPDATGVFGFTDLQARLVYDVSDRQQLQASIVAGRSHYADPEGDTPNTVEDGFNRAGLLTVAWRSVLSGASVLTQRLWAVPSDFHNDNPWEQSLADGRSREFGYRADLSSSL